RKSINQVRLPLVVSAAFVMASVTNASAQTRSLTWTESVQVEVPGALGVLLRSTGATTPVSTHNAVHLQGSTLIQETDNAGTVIDLENSKWLMVDHDAQVYTAATFDEMAQLTDEALGGLHTGAAGGEPDPDAAAARE